MRKLFKTIGLTILISAGVTLSAVAETTTPFYLAFDGFKTTFGRSADLKRFQGDQSLKDNHKQFGFNLAFGTQAVNHFGMEIGARWHENSSSSSSTATWRMKPRGIYFDLIGYPWVLNNLSLSTTIGLSLSSPRLTVTENQIKQKPYSDTAHRTGLRLGAGFNWALSSHAKARFQMIYQSAHEPFKQDISLGAGFLYFF